MTARLRAAAIGGGVISAHHLEFLAASARADLAAVCDLSPATAEHAATRYGAAAYYHDVAAMLAAEQPDVVHVLTPPQTHGALAEAALEAGAHVICEKPVTATAPELEKLLAMARERGRRLIESHNYRFNDGVRRLRGAIDDGSLGSIHDVDIRIALAVTDPTSRFADPNLAHPIHQMPAGVVHDFATHFAYLLGHLAPHVRYDRIAAAWSNHAGTSGFRYDDLDAILVGTGPCGPLHARLRFEANTRPECLTIAVRGNRGRAATDLYQPFFEILVPRPGGDQLTPVVNHLANGAGLFAAGLRNLKDKILQRSPYHGMHRMLDEVYAALQDDREPPITERDMLTASELVDRLLDESVRV